MRFSTASCSAASIRSEAHVPAVLLPQPAHRGFCDARFARLDAAPAHLDERRALRRACRAALHEPGRGAVLERDVACGTDEVRLPHAQLVHLRVVRLVAEAGPHELGPARSLRQHLPHGAGRTELVWTCFGYESDDAKMDELRMRQSNLVGPAGYISLEDGAATGFVQRGAAGASERSSFVEMGGRSVESSESRVTETSVRGLWQQYRRHMGL